MRGFSLKKAVAYLLICAVLAIIIILLLEHFVIFRIPGAE